MVAVARTKNLDVALKFVRLLSDYIIVQNYLLAFCPAALFFLAFFCIVLVRVRSAKCHLTLSCSHFFIATFIVFKASLYNLQCVLRILPQI